MNFVAIILRALFPLSPARQVYELARVFLTKILNTLADPATVSWLCANADDPKGIAGIESCIDDLNAAIDFVVYLMARAMLGLPVRGCLRLKSTPLHRRRTRSFEELLARLDACVLRFAAIERLAHRRARKLKRLLNHADQPGAPAQAHFNATSIERAARACLHLSRSDWGRWMAVSSRPDGGGSHAGIPDLRPGLRVRAPP
jgi:hypothetical protein